MDVVVFRFQGLHKVIYSNVRLDCAIGFGSFNLFQAHFQLSKARNSRFFAMQESAGVPVAVTAK